MARRDAPPALPSASAAWPPLSPLLRLRADEQLVALFRAGNEQAFEVIHDRYRQRLFVYARQMLAARARTPRTRSRTSSCAPTAALRANGRPVSLKAWLYRVAHNRCVDQIRRPRPSPSRSWRTRAARCTTRSRWPSAARTCAAWWPTCSGCPSQQRSVLLMREIDGLAYSELAEAHDVTVPAVKSLLVRARMGLVEAREARDTACREVRGDLCLAHDRGVRVSGLARRHLRDCAGCRDFRTALRSTRRSFGALVPGALGPLGAILHALGIGGSGGGGAAGAAAPAGRPSRAPRRGGPPPRRRRRRRAAAARHRRASAPGARRGAAASGVAAGPARSGGAGALTATKVAAVVASAAVVAGGSAVEVNQIAAIARRRRGRPR